MLKRKLLSGFVLISSMAIAIPAFAYSNGGGYGGYSNGCRGDKGESMSSSSPSAPGSSGSIGGFNDRGMQGATGTESGVAHTQGGQIGRAGGVDIGAMSHRGGAPDQSSQRANRSTKDRN